MAQVQAANRAKDEFLAVLSHELRNPLAAIQAGVDVLRRLGNADDPRPMRTLELVQRNVKLQARLVEDLLDLSRAARGKLTIVRAPVELDKVVLSAVQACRADAARAGVSLDTHVESGIWVEADGDRVQQVVINLVGNGIKFTPKGGRVGVSVATLGDSAHIIVEDTGLGIDADLLPKIFDMFQQGEIEARRAPGLGVGLALVKSIAELHGGRVWADSGGRGQGSRFTVALPLHKATAERAAATSPSPESTRIKMLLVEDNSDTRMLLSEAFADLAYQVVSAESAEEALDILSREAVDVIVADIGLPGMDGYDLLRAARRLPSTVNVLAFALTGYGEADDVRRAHDAGYVDHFTKPVDVALLDERIRSRVQQVRSLR
jgi:CheY-like chemotaxis protein